MGPLVVLGDSVFDNGAYVEAGAPSVAQQLRTRLPLIDLGRVLGEPDRDYATPIEPSAHGGRRAGSTGETDLTFDPALPLPCHGPPAPPRAHPRSPARRARSR